MRRSTNAGLTALQAALAGIGGGFLGYGKDKTAREEKEERERERQAREAERQEDLRARYISAGFDPLDTALASATGKVKAGETAGMFADMGPTPGPFGGASSALANALKARGQQATEDVGTGRRVTAGGQDYVMPFSRTAEGQRQATIAEQRRRETVAQQNAREANQLEIEAEQRKFERDKELRRIPQAQTFAPDRPARKMDLDEFVLQKVAEFAARRDSLTGQGPSPDEVDAYEQSLRRIAQRQTGVVPPAPATTPSRAGEADEETAARSWMATNKRRTGETNAEYAARMRAAVRGGR